MKQKFNVGDIVKVIDFGECPFGIGSQMKDYVGCFVRIVDVCWRRNYGAYQYTIAEDEGKWWWSDNCFERERCVDLPEFHSASPDELDDLFL